MNATNSYPTVAPSSASEGIITTSVTVTVTIGEVRKNIFSYVLLWVCFLLSSLLCAYQVFRDRRSAIQKARDVENSTPETDGSSSGDKTRQLFYRLLLVALLSRVLLMPIAVYSVSPWLQFAATTFPMMAFASAWALLVSFFVQLVAAATGTTGDYSNPSIVMQSIAYTLYAILIATYIGNRNASVLVFALICCVYAGLFGTLVYFGPRLMALLKLRLSRRPELATRLIICCAICILMFAARTIALANMVVAPPKTLRWWWSYGALELFPSVVLLGLMHPLPNQSSKPESPSVIGSSSSNPALSNYTTRRGSNQSEASVAGTAAGYLTGSNRAREQIPLMKPTPVYGAAGGKQ